MKIKGMKKPEMVVDSGCGLVDKWPLWKKSWSYEIRGSALLVLFGGEWIYYYNLNLIKSCRIVDKQGINTIDMIKARLTE